MRHEQSFVRMHRVIGHWDGGTGTATAEGREAYNLLVQQDCAIIQGNHEVGDNVVTSDGDYAAHTLRLNTGSIGVALCGMGGAQEYPFDAGDHPINENQFDTFCRLIADLCQKHRIPVTPETVLTHAEVETTLGVKQRGKWDISVLPFGDEDREFIFGSRAVGDLMRERVREYLKAGTEAHYVRPALKFGDRGVAVIELQTDLAALGYVSGRIDGEFGKLTRAAVLAFQADNDLHTDGVVGAATWAKINDAPARADRNITQAEIDETSGTAKDAKMTARVADVIGLGGAATVVNQVSEATDTIEAASGTLERLSSVIVANWPVVALGGACLVAWLVLRSLSHNTRKRRLMDAVTNRSLAR